MNDSEKAMVACGRCCCICHKFCGTKMEVHHIKQKAYDGEDSFENYIPLCLDCHAEMGKADPNHSKGKRYTENELKQHRDNWYKKVRESPCLYYSEDNSEADKKLFVEICDVFTEDMRRYLKDVDIGGSHSIDAFDPLLKLLRRQEDPFFEFINVEIEKSKAKLLSSINDFLGYKANNTFVRKIADREIGVTRQWMVNHEDWIPHNMSFDEYNQVFEKDAEKLNTLATEVWNCYDDFVRQNRRILNI